MDKLSPLFPVLRLLQYPVLVARQGTRTLVTRATSEPVWYVVSVTVHVADWENKVVASLVFPPRSGCSLCIIYTSNSLFMRKPLMATKDRLPPYHDTRPAAAQIIAAHVSQLFRVPAEPSHLA